MSSAVEVITPEHALPRLPVARALMVPAPDLPTAAEAWITCGGPHHTAFTQALGIEVLEDLAEMLEIELVSIDAGTRVRELSRELRWNAAAYQLAHRP